MRFFVAQVVAFAFGMLVAVAVMKKINPQLMQDGTPDNGKNRMMPPPHHGPQHNPNRKK